MQISKTKRGHEWICFSHNVLNHIDAYTVPQYGDMPDDQASGFSQRDIVQNIRRYINRAESNARGLVEARRDCLKIAHYACMLWAKLQKEEES